MDNGEHYQQSLVFQMPLVGFLGDQRHKTCLFVVGQDASGPKVLDHGNSIVLNEALAHHQYFGCQSIKAMCLPF